MDRCSHQSRFQKVTEYMTPVLYTWVCLYTHTSTHSKCLGGTLIQDRLIPVTSETEHRNSYSFFFSYHSQIWVRKEALLHLVAEEPWLLLSVAPLFPRVWNPPLGLLHLAIRRQDSGCEPLEGSGLRVAQLISTPTCYWLQCNHMATLTPVGSRGVQPGFVPKSQCFFHVRKQKQQNSKVLRSV